MKSIRTIILGLSLLLANIAQAHDGAFKPGFVDTLVTPYLSMQKALSSDDLSAAQIGAKSFLKSMEQAPSGSKRVDSVVEDMSAPAKSIAQATTLATAREAFATLSTKMESLIAHVGVSADTDLYLAHCPMALGGKGGDWLQADKTITNPYFGAMMLHCGSIQKQVAGDANAKSMPAGHQH